MTTLPTEVWAEILQAGISNSVLDYRDLCSLSIVCPSLNRLASLTSLWKPIFLRDFPQSSQDGVCSPAHSDFKTAYRKRFEKIRAAKVAAHKRRVLRMQSQGVVLAKECKELEELMHLEKTRLSSILSELKCLEQARKASVALKLWQPHTVRLMQQQVVEQLPIDPEIRKHTIEMEAKVCMEEIKRCNSSMERKRSLFEMTKKEMEFLTYNPMQDLHTDFVHNTPTKKSTTKKTKS